MFNNEILEDMKNKDIFDPVKCPKHYAGDWQISCMRAMQSMMYQSETKLKAAQVYWWGCAFKYLWRFLWKNGIQDLDKCKRCIDYLIDDIHLKGMNFELDLEYNNSEEKLKVPLVYNLYGACHNKGFGHFEKKGMNDGAE